MGEVIKSSKTQSFSTHAGANIHAYFQGKEIGAIQAIAYSINREKAALYVMGKPSPIGYSRGKRAIAGSLIFLMLDRNALLEAFSSSVFTSGAGESPLGSKEYSQGNQVVSGETSQTAINGFDQFDAELETPWYEDQIPPFDIVISAVNEYGASSYLQVIGVEILNSNGGFSVDDLALEHQYTFVAQDVLAWRSGGVNFINEVGHGKRKA